MGDGRWKQMFFFLAIQGQPDDDEMIVLVWNHPILSVLFTMATLRSSDFVVRRFNFREGFLKMGDLKWCKFGWFGVPPTLGNFHIYILYAIVYIYLYLYLYFFLGVKPTFDSTRFSNHSITPSRWMLKHGYSPNGMVYVRNICISMDQDLWLGFENWSVCNIWNKERQVHWFYLHMKSHLWWISYLQWLNSAD